MNVSFTYYSGRWFRIDVFQTPVEYFNHILRKIGAPFVDGVRKMRHLKHPMMVTESIRFSYKIFEEELFIRMLQEQHDVPIKINAAYTKCGSLIVNDPYAEDDPIAALRAAEKRAGNMSRSESIPKVRSSVVIGEGEGRSTREFELQWWPELYKTNYGKLTFRFFVNKVHM